MEPQKDPILTEQSWQNRAELKLLPSLTLEYTKAIVVKTAWSTKKKKKNIVQWRE